MDDREKLLEDLRLHQAELEAQNEELRAAQHALEASRSKYADLFELAPVGYFTLDEHGMIWDVNLIGAAQLGQARSALDRKPFRIFVDPKYRDAFRVHHAHVFTTGKRATCELEFIRRDRTKFFGRLDSVPLDERDGYKKCFTAVTNVTNQKQAEESLRESEEKFRLIAELSSDVIFQLNAAGKITYASPAVNRYGFKPEKLIGTAFTAYVHPQDLTRAEHTLQQVASGRRIDMLELQLRYANGSYYYADINVTPVKRQGSIAGIQGIMRDITERKRYERAILRSLGRFELLSGTADTLLLSTDPQTVVETVCTKVLEHLDCQVYFNFLVDERAGKLHLNAFAGIPPDEAVKIEWLDFGHAVCGCAARDRQRIVAECISTTPDDRTSLVRSYGVKCYACHPLMGPGGKVIGTLSFGARNRDTFSNDDLLVMKAIADQVAVAMNRMNDEQSLRSAHTELERRAYELEAVNRELEAFSYTVSHDLKAPLRSIEGFAEALSEDYAGKMDATGKDYLGRISAAALRMNQFIDAMLGMARLTRTELHEQTVDLSGLARIIAHDLQKQEPGRAVEFVIAEGVKTEGDHAMLRAVIENLLQNAWKFTSRHAEAKIEFGVMNSAAGDKSKFDKPEPAPSTSGPRTEPDSEIFNQRNSKPVYYVSDNGVGFDMRFANKLFQPFKRLHTDSDFPGLGIGLATANRIILRHNGRLWAESEPGRGATFYFTLG